MLAAMSLYSLAADLILLLHFSYVAFVVLGLLLVWIGWLRRWGFVRNLYFRAAHLGAMAVVVVESVFGITCPLTTWEHELRLKSGSGVYEESFMEHWVHRIMFFELEPSTFTAMYVVFFAALVLSFIVVRPTWPGRRAKGPR